jgi:hypothetical protein
MPGQRRRIRGEEFADSGFSREAPGSAPDGKKIDTPWRRLHSDFVLAKAAQKKSVPAA